MQQRVGKAQQAPEHSKICFVHFFWTKFFNKGAKLRSCLLEIFSLLCLVSSCSSLPPCSSCQSISHNIHGCSMFSSSRWYNFWICKPSAFKSRLFFFFFLLNSYYTATKCYLPHTYFLIPPSKKLKQGLVFKGKLFP